MSTYTRFVAIASYKKKKNYNPISYKLVIKHNMMSCVETNLNLLFP